MSWPGEGGFKDDPSSLKFSLINKLNKPIKIKCIPPEKPIVSNKGYGPIFGSYPHDILYLINQIQI